MKTVFAALLILFTSAAADAQDKAVCKVSAKFPSFPSSAVEEKTIHIDLTEDYRYLSGKADFRLLSNTVNGSIEILTWGGRGGQVFENTYTVGPFKMTGVGQDVVMTSDNSTVHVNCTLVPGRMTELNLANFDDRSARSRPGPSSDCSALGCMLECGDVTCTRRPYY